MTVLAFDTSCACAKVAITKDGKLLGEAYENDMRTHSVKLMPMIDECMKNAGLTPCDIDLIGVVTGPGSFTGLRIGVATAKSVAFAKNIPVVGINTLDFLAEASFEYDAVVCPIIDARNENVYCDIYVGGESGAGCEVRTIDEIADMAKETAVACRTKNIIFTGDAAKKYADKLSFATLNDGTEGTAHTLCKLSEKHQNEAVSAAELEVNYYRMAQAERMKNA